MSTIEATLQRTATPWPPDWARTTKPQTLNCGYCCNTSKKTGLQTEPNETEASSSRRKRRQSRNSQQSQSTAWSHLPAHAPRCGTATKRRYDNVSSFSMCPFVLFDPTDRSIGASLAVVLSFAQIVCLPN